jgi:hypothetical protein
LVSSPEVEIDLQLFMQKKLARSIDKEMNSKKSFKSRTTKDVTSIVKSKANVELILRAVTKILIQYQLVAWIQSVFFQDVEELLPKLDHLYMMSAWTC